MTEVLSVENVQGHISWLMIPWKSLKTRKITSFSAQKNLKKTGKNRVKTDRS